MAQRGAYKNRNAGHKTRQAALFAVAENDHKRLGVAFDWFRSSAAVLSRRRPPKGALERANEQTAARLIREMTAHLKAMAEAIDRGDYDAER